ncbi:MULTISPECIES: phage tail protein [unclassified Sphingomonas]|uniref:phage tail protein n=1 Tax=unclassified Sphingomonas TaxID=196159 RepID=UPI00226A4DA3|nr:MULTISPECIES: phage tail protein [unclassified Sphingomonas]
MKKPDALRKYLLAAVAALASKPENLSLFVDKGRIGARAGSLSYEHRYTLNVVVQDYAGDIDKLFVPLLAWISDNQPELLQQDKQEPFSFEADLLDGELVDVSIDIELTERVLVERTADGTRVTALGEPNLSDVFDGVDPATPWTGLLDDIIAAGVAEAA